MDFLINNFFGPEELGQYPILKVLIPVLLLWSLLWKGLALWNASKNNQKNWFIAILVLNTLGILEITYLFYFAKNKLKLNELLTKVKSGL